MKHIEERFQMEIRGKQIPAKIVRETRRSIRASVGKEAVTLRMPLRLSVQEQKDYLEKFKEWLEKQLEKHPEMLARFESKGYESGDTLLVGKRQYLLDISYTNKSSSSGKLKNGAITLSVSQAAEEQIVAALLSRLVGKDFLSEITKRVLELNAQYFRKPIRSVVLKNLHSRWGSCSNKGNINLSTRLLFAPEEVRDYVIVHELAHLVEMNHSPRFWKVVAEVMPDYKERQQWLKENGEACRF